MWTPKKLLSLTAIFLLLSISAAHALQAGGRLGAKERWAGEVVLKEAVTIPAQGTLTIAPGTKIRPSKPEARIVVEGILKAQGTAAQPIAFTGSNGWQGIEFIEGAPAGSVFEHTRFDGAETAISSIAAAFSVRSSSFENCGTAIKLLRESNPQIENCRFNRNEIGVDNEMKSAPAIRRSHFSGHKKTAILASHNSTGPIENNTFEKNEQAIGLIQKYADRIVGNTFRDNVTAIFCNQTQNTPTIRDNLFEKNGNALINFSFSYPAVEKNRFTGNETAIRNDQFGSPLVANNLFRDNRTALYNYRKSNPKVEKNRLENNDLALFCDYSSYPQVKNNNFAGNRMGVKLGIYQSADWEKRSGSKAIVQENAQARQSKNPLLAQAPSEFNDKVDVSGNWWGKDTPLLAGAGKNGNLAIFHDRLDQPEVSYEGFGAGKYRLDLIVFTPWLTKAVADAGPGPERRK